MEHHFEQFGKNVIGNGTTFETPYGEQKLLYADWIASGRLYGPIEEAMIRQIGPMVANTHSFSSEAGKASTYAYYQARKIIKQHVHAGDDDVLIATGTGMTSLLSKLQRIMGLRISNMAGQKDRLPQKDRPVVFISHMEHHSNHISWMETIADVVIVPCNTKQLVCSDNLAKELNKYQERTLKIGAFTACSNVTGIITPYHELAKVMHSHNGYCIVDFAASAPYVAMDMHPENEAERLDGILFSPHKFLGGPGSCGVLVFNKALYRAEIPDSPGGGNVKWTNPWGGYAYFDNIETKEDGGTPGFLQVMRAAMAIRLKEKMGVEAIEQREKELLNICFSELSTIPGLFILGATEEKRIGCVSFGVEGIHYNLMVRLLNDRFGIQVRGGWSCASTYGHHLFGLNSKESKEITDAIDKKDLAGKPGWVRLSLHPLMGNNELQCICNAVKKIVDHISDWKNDYSYNPNTNEFEHIFWNDEGLIEQVEGWFK